MKHLLLAALSGILLVACADRNLHEKKVEPDVFLKEGLWQMKMDLGKGQSLPFMFQLQKNGETYFAEIINGTEKIRSLPFTLIDDSICFRLPIFDSDFRMIRKSADRFEGYWYNYTRCCDYNIPATAVYGISDRFEKPDGSTSETAKNFNGKWKVVFSPDSENQYLAVGLFEQKNDHITGTFLTETGDYRFLEGRVFGERMLLSCFDGSHAFLFDALMNEKEEISGQFYSGTHWQESWRASRDDQFELTNPDSLTFIKPGYNGLAFRFPNLDGHFIDFPSAQYEGKVVIVQIMGSWCPNCMDETAYLKSVYDQYHRQGLEIISLCYERSDVFEQSVKSVNKHKTHLAAEWEFLIAGSSSNKNQAAASLPMLNHVMSFPTSIYIDRRGVVRKIHTGFYGPGTGSYFTRFAEMNSSFIEKLLAE